MSGYLRFSMGRRQDDSKEETWKTKHWYIPELYGHKLKIEKNYTGTKKTWSRQRTMVMGKAATLLVRIM